MGLCRVPTWASRKQLELALALVLTACLGAMPLTAQSTASQAPVNQFALTSPTADRPSFEVASIKLNKSSDPATYNIPMGAGDAMRPVGGLFSVTNEPLINIILFAYKLTGNFQYLMPGLPSWVGSERFDIQARAAGTPKKDEFRLMVQSLLADRFKLTMHHETRQLPVFALVLSKAGKTGPQLTAHTDDATCGSPAGQPYPSSAAAPLPKMPCNALLALQPSAPGRIRAGGRNLTLQLLASSFSGYENFDRPIVDRTGLTGGFDLWFEWAPQFNGTPPAGFQADSTAATFRQALQEQLGLKLESQMAPVDVMVVDHIEEPSAN